MGSSVAIIIIIIIIILTIIYSNTRVGTLIVATIYLQLIQNRYMFRSFTVLRLPHRWQRVVHNAGDYTEGQ